MAGNARKGKRFVVIATLPTLITTFPRIREIVILAHMPDRTTFIRENKSQLRK